MKNNKQFWTLRYAIINMSFFAGFCCIHAYASVFLLAKGFSNSVIGITLALASIASVLVQPIVAGFIDKPGKATNRNSIMVSLIIMALMGVAMIFATNKIAIFIVFALSYMIQMLVQPLIIALNFEYQKKGCDINFGLARGLGSCGFASLSPFLGNWIVRFGEGIMPWVFIVSLAVCFLFVITFVVKEIGDGKIEEGAKEGIDVEEIEDGADKAHNNFFEFAKYYPKFMLYLVAIICFFFGHNALNDYLFQIISPLGCNEATMGYMVSVAAFLELPTMALFVVMAKKIGFNRLLKISGIMFTIKVIVMFLAGNVAMVMLSQICQIGAYALFTPANAYYSDRVMEAHDRVKGQAYSNAALTLGGVFSGLVCGRLLDVAGPKMMLLVAAIVSGVGAVIALYAVERDK